MTTDGTQQHRTAGDAGVAIVEAAIAVPLLLVLVFGFIELTGAVRAYATAESAVRSATRAASVAAADPLADRAILARLRAESAPLGPDVIDFVVVWHASGPGERLPAPCRPASYAVPNAQSLGVTDGGVDAVGACNIYLRPGAPTGVFQKLDLPVAELPFGCAGSADPLAASRVDCRWPAQNRRVVATPRTVLGPGIPTDFVGVFVQYRHQRLVGLFGQTMTITESAVNLIEPRAYGIT
jgi:hypothetical protein